MSGNYYNEFDPFAAAWLRELMKAGLIPGGDVDERSIVDVRPDDLRGFRQCHFFAGIGGWPYALELAGWPDDREVWTGSCPCQPFSVAGAGKGEDDSRHLWPEFRRLIAECRPEHVFGEQVGGAAGRTWLAGVHVDLEALAYRVGAADLCAAGVGAPHIRQRLFWVADTERDGGRADLALGRPQGRDAARRTGEGGGLADTGREGRQPERGISAEQAASGTPGGLTHSSAHGGLADTDQHGQHRARGTEAQPGSDGQDGRLHRGGSDGGLGDTDDARLEGERANRFAIQDNGMSGRTGGTTLRLGDANGSGRREGHGGIAPGEPAWANRGAEPQGPWADSYLLDCGDGKSRRAPSGVPLLVTGLPGRVGLLRGLGNSIVPQVGAAFISAYMEV